MPFLDKLWWLLVAHALTDYALQTEMIGKYKNPWNQAPPHLGPWWWHMLAHGLLNGGGVALVTHRIDLGCAELWVHISMDTLKCMMEAWGRDDPDGVKLWTWIDQGVHLGSKLLWAYLA